MIEEVKFESFKHILISFYHKKNFEFCIRKKIGYDNLYGCSERCSPDPNNLYIES